MVASRLFNLLRHKSQGVEYRSGALSVPHRINKEPADHRFLPDERSRRVPQSYQSEPGVGRVVVDLLLCSFACGLDVRGIRGRSERVGTGDHGWTGVNCPVTVKRLVAYESKPVVGRSQGSRSPFFRSQK